MKMLPVAIPGSVAEFAKRGDQATADALDAVFRVPNRQVMQQNGVSVDLETYKWQKIMEFREALDNEIAKKRQQAQKDIEEAERKKWQTLMDFQKSLQGEIEQKTNAPAQFGHPQQYPQQYPQQAAQHTNGPSQFEHSRQFPQQYSQQAPQRYLHAQKYSQQAPQSNLMISHNYNAPSPQASSTMSSFTTAPTSPPMASALKAGLRPLSINEMGPSLVQEEERDDVGGYKDGRSWTPRRDQSFDHQRSVMTSGSSAYGITSITSAPARQYQSPYLSSKSALALNAQNRVKSSASWAPAPNVPAVSARGHTRLLEAEELEKEYARLTGRKDIRATAMQNVKKMQEERRRKLEELTSRVIENRRRLAHEVKVADRPLEISFSKTEKREDGDSGHSEQEAPKRRTALDSVEDDTSRDQGGDGSRENTFTDTEEGPNTMSDTEEAQDTLSDTDTRDFLHILRDRRKKAREEGGHRDFFSILPKSEDKESSSKSEETSSRDDLLTKVQKKKITLPKRDPKQARLNRRKSAQKLTESRPWNQDIEDQDYHRISRSVSSRGRATSRKRDKSNGRNKAGKSTKENSSSRSTVERRVEKRKNASRKRAEERERRKSASRGRGSENADRNNISRSRGSKSADRNSISRGRATRKPDKDLTMTKKQDLGPTGDEVEPNNFGKTLSSRNQRRRKTTPPSVVSELSASAYGVAPSYTGSGIIYDDDESQRKQKASARAKAPAHLNQQSIEDIDENFAVAPKTQATKISDQMIYVEVASSGSSSEEDEEVAIVKPSADNETNTSSTDDEEEAIAKAVAKAMGKITLTANSVAEGFEIEESSTILHSIRGEQLKQHHQKNSDSAFDETMEALRALETRLSIDEGKGESLLPDLLELTNVHGWDVKKIVKHFVRSLPELAKLEVEGNPLQDSSTSSRPMNIVQNNHSNQAQIISPLKTSDRADPVSPRTNSSKTSVGRDAAPIRAQSDQELRRPDPSKPPMLPDFSKRSTPSTQTGSRDLQQNFDDSSMPVKPTRSQASHLDESLLSQFEKRKQEDSIELKYSDLRLGGIKLDELRLDQSLSTCDTAPPPLASNGSKGGWRDRIHANVAPPTPEKGLFRDRIETDREPITPRSPKWVRNDASSAGNMIRSVQSECPISPKQEKGNTSSGVGIRSVQSDREPIPPNSPKWVRAETTSNESALRASESQGSGGWRERVKTFLKEEPLSPKSPQGIGGKTLSEAAPPPTSPVSPSPSFSGTVWSAPAQREAPSSPKSPEGWRERIRFDASSKPSALKGLNNDHNNDARVKKGGIDMSSVRQTLAAKRTKQPGIGSFKPQLESFAEDD